MGRWFINCMVFYWRINLKRKILYYFGEIIIDIFVFRWFIEVLCMVKVKLKGIKLFWVLDKNFE